MVITKLDSMRIKLSIDWPTDDDVLPASPSKEGRILLGGIGGLFRLPNRRAEWM